MEEQKDTGAPIEDTDTGALVDRRSFWLGKEIDAHAEVERGLADLRRARHEIRLGDIPPLVHTFGRRAFDVGFRDGEKRGIHEGEKRAHHEVERLKL